MKPLDLLAACLVALLIISGPALAAPAGTPKQAAAPAAKPVPPGFPLVLKGAEVMITSQLQRPDLEAKLRKLIGAKTQLEEKSMTQYDVRLNPNQAPMGLVFHWDKQDKLTQVSLDAYSEIQNPPAKELKRWLTKNAGPGKSGKSKQQDVTLVTWDFNGWHFIFSQGGDGEDSSYSFEITPLTAKSR